MIKKKILIVDDDDVTLNFFKRLLSKNGYTIFLASNGREGLRMLNYMAVDLIMLDMIMPELTGIEILKIIREKEITDVPILMITGSVDVDQQIQAYKLDVYDFIKKPEHPEVILKRIENGLKIGEMINFNNSVKNELHLAKRLQRYLYPEPELNAKYADIHTWSHPLSDIGGDIHDYIEFRDKRIIFYVADVSGHGISAAIFTATVRLIFRNCIKKTQGPGELLTLMNVEFSEILPIESFVTIFCGLYDPKRRVIKYSNGGHIMPYYLTDGKLIELEGSGPFLGPVKKMKFAEYEIDVGDSGSLLVYTDGVLDITDSNSVPIGKKLLLGLLKTEGMTPFEKFNTMKKNILNEDVLIKDDCTMLLINFK